jgi:hypothetical protein
LGDQTKGKKGQVELTKIGFDGPFPSTNAISGWSLIAHQSSNFNKRGTAARTTHVHERSIGLCAELSDARQLGISIKEASHARVVRGERRHQMHLTVAKALAGETWYGSSIPSGHPWSWCRSGKPARSCSMDVFETIHVLARSIA